jgi:hypothetical protein
MPTTATVQVTIDLTTDDAEAAHGTAISYAEALGEALKTTAASTFRLDASTATATAARVNTRRSTPAA